MNRITSVAIAVALLTSVLSSGCITEQQETSYNEFDANGAEAAVPQGVTATAGERSDGVLVSWEPVDDVDGYEVVRDGETTFEVDADAVEMLDEDADAPQPPELPYDIEATDDDGAGVGISWQFDTPEPGAEHDYVVYGVVDGEPGEASESATGYRGSYGVEFQVYSEADDQWYEAGDETNFFHEDAPYGQLEEAGDARATKGIHVDRMMLGIDGLVTTEGPDNDYRVRVTDGHNDEQTSAPVTGRRGEFMPDVQWQRSTIDEPSDFVDVSGANSAPYGDTDAPSDGIVRYWRAELTVPGEPPVLTGTDWGFRAIDCGLDDGFDGEFSGADSGSELGGDSIDGDANLQALWDATSPAYNGDDPQELSPPVSVDQATVTATSSFPETDDRPATEQFWLQDGQTSMRVHVDADDVTDDVEVGQQVSFEATEMNVFNANPEVYELTDFSVDSSGDDVPFYDLRTEEISIDEHYYELIRVGGRLESGFPCGGNYSCYDLTYGTLDERRSVPFRTASDEISGGDCVTYVGPVIGFLGPKVVDDAEPEPQLQTDALEWTTVGEP